MYKSLKLPGSQATKPSNQISIKYQMGRQNSHKFRSKEKIYTCVKSVGRLLIRAADHNRSIQLRPTYMSEPIPGETRFAIKGQTRHILYTTFPGIQSSSIEGRKYGIIILTAN